MANYCDNYIEVIGSKELVEKLADATSKGRLFDFLHPLPDKYYKNKETGELFEAVLGGERANLDNWYFWRCENWGTKWEIDQDESHWEISEENDGRWKFMLTCLTAWSPPLKAFSHFMENQSDDVEALIAYLEPAVGFAGVWRGDDDDIEYSMDSDFHDMDGEFWNTEDGILLNDVFNMKAFMEETREMEREMEAEAEKEEVEEKVAE